MQGREPANGCHAENDGLLDGCRQAGERVNQRVQRLHQRAQRPLPALAQVDEQGFERAGQLFEVALEVVGAG